MHLAGKTGVILEEALEQLGARSRIVHILYPHSPFAYAECDHLIKIETIPISFKKNEDRMLVKTVGLSLLN